MKLQRLYAKITARLIGAPPTTALTTPRPSAKVLFDSANVGRHARPFAKGITTSKPRLAPFTSADLEWAAQHLNANARDYDVIGKADTDLEFQAAVAEVQSRMGAGHSIV